ncbi:MAG: hypothetical protein DSY79_05390 [Chloroflexi bacterium]|nr:MAG: hypothetical protein COA56_06805 [Dehalococcoidia bacterium]PKB84545.1 MAG: hypothetical protein BZY86_07230 [SAR202 cluster bacterium MP-NPac-SRR3961935-G1]RUA21605.1 MAG: hypothetical protein DSY79_05390 [Chloroflexota bacterium]RUA32974.1 MAG: hypothetical protein DSY78_01315 [Chloroflexota bacterium]
MVITIGLLINRIDAASQDSIATWLLDELVSEGDLKKLLSESGEKLVRLADEALAEHTAAHTKELDPDRL